MVFGAVRASSSTCGNLEKVSGNNASRGMNRCPLSSASESDPAPVPVPVSTEESFPYAFPDSLDLFTEALGSRGGSLFSEEPLEPLGPELGPESESESESELELPFELPTAGCNKSPFLSLPGPPPGRPSLKVRLRHCPPWQPDPGYCPFLPQHLQCLKDHRRDYHYRFQLRTRY